MQKLCRARPHKVQRKNDVEFSTQGVLRKAAQGVLHKLLPIVTLFSKALFTIMFTHWVGGGGGWGIKPARVCCLKVP